MKPLIIIHGWSDSADSFIPLAEAIEKKTERKVEQIWLGNYISLDDCIQMDDLVRGLSLAWKKQKLPVNPKGTDVIIHSTGGLIIRDWMESQYLKKGGNPPVNNLVMLAPANFGSPLAHQGRAFYGRVIKGFKAEKQFETGTQILKALEMASPYSWNLAQRDRFVKNVFSSSGVRTTVIVGNTGYGGISSLANKDGSDGTVYVSSANLNCEYLQIDFASNPQKPKVQSKKSSLGETAFLVADGYNHSTVALKGNEKKNNKQLLENIVKAINIRSQAEFKTWIKDCIAKTDYIMKKNSSKDYKHGFQNTVFHVTDDRGFEIEDYVVEFYQDAEKDFLDKFAEFFNNKVVSNVHGYKDNSAYRSFIIDCTELYKVIDKDNEFLKISLSAMPNYNDEKNIVGYRTFEDEDIGSVKLNPKELKQFFIPNRTLFIDVILKRKHKNELFTINRVNDTKEN